jgi:hypothetical protein
VEQYGCGSTFLANVRSDSEADTGGEHEKAGVDADAIVETDAFRLMKEKRDGFQGRTGNSLGKEP